MADMVTNYGTIKGISSARYDENNNLVECMVSEYSELKTVYGTLIPKYLIEDARTKHRNALSFYSSGNLKSIYLENKVNIITTIGELNAELLTFYEDGTLHRIFPQYGQINGYWTEENEYDCAEIINISLPVQRLEAKILQACFYKEGEIKSITFWRKDSFLVNISERKIRTRIGVSFYKSGVVKTLEPSIPVRVTTSIGIFHAYQTNPMGIHGDSNSLCFNEDGSVNSFYTVSNRVVVNSFEKPCLVIEPKYRPSQLDPEVMELIPIQIAFKGNNLHIIDSDKYNHNFDLERIVCKVEEVQFLVQECDGTDCSTCGKCDKNT